MNKPDINPFVSILIPTYNSSQYISDTIMSVIDQSYKNFELIIIDDESTDNTLDILDYFKEKDARISYYQIKHSGRPSIPFNYGLKLAKGKYVAFLGSDDIWEKEKLSAQVYYLENHYEAVLVYSMSVTFGDVNILSPKYEVLPLPFRAARTKDDLVKIGNTLPASSVLARLEIVKKVGYHDEDPALELEDYHLWLKMTSYGIMGFIPRIHLYYRVHQNQFSGNWEIRRERIKYIARKTGLPIPNYKEIRNGGLLFLMARNFIHFFIFILYSLLGKVQEFIKNKCCLHRKLKY